jgi:hypothetical protein
MKVNELLNNLNGWQRIGFMSSIGWVVFWLIFALASKPENSLLWRTYNISKNMFDPKWKTDFQWFDFLVILFLPAIALALWNAKKLFNCLFNWVKEGFIKGDKL